MADGTIRPQAVSTSSTDLRGQAERVHCWESACSQLKATLLACSSLLEPSSERDAVWFAVQAAVCTRGAVRVVPLGSSRLVRVTCEQSTDELIAAMTWLLTHEARARVMTPSRLLVTMRGVATRGAGGSARSAQSDGLHGMTGVPGGRLVSWCSVEADRAVG